MKKKILISLFVVLLLCLGGIVGYDVFISRSANASLYEEVDNIPHRKVGVIFERVRIISQMNTAFREYFTTGEFNRLCKVSIAQGNSAFAHEMSSLGIRSGFKITIENDSSL